MTACPFMGSLSPDRTPAGVWLPEPVTPYYIVALLGAAGTTKPVFHSNSDP